MINPVRDRRQKKNIWKILFLILLSINVMIILGLAILFFLALQQEEIDYEVSEIENHSEFVIQTGKQDLTKLINYYIEKEGLNGPIDYTVFLTDEVELYGEVQIFSQKMQLKMTFEPHALQNGDLVLEQKSLSLGDVALPVSYVLKFIRDAYKFPEWVIIQPNDHKIYVALREMRLNSGIQVRAEEFNLKDDHISMRMLVPISK